MRCQSQLVCIGGGSGSGKTTAATEVGAELIKIQANLTYTIISMDVFYHPLGLTNFNYNYDEPDAFDMKLAVQCLLDLLGGNSTNIPIYDYSIHDRVGTKTIQPANVIIFEGLFALYDCFQEIAALTMFIDCDMDVMICRRIQRDMAERGRSVDNIIGQYFAQVRPMFTKHVLPTRTCAKYVVNNNGQDGFPVAYANIACRMLGYN